MLGENTVAKAVKKYIILANILLGFRPILSDIGEKITAPVA